jgi:hypothetical protein
MRVTSPLADVEFKFGPIRREGNKLVLSSAADQPMQTTVYVSPRDVIAFLGKFLTSGSALGFVLGFPLFWLRGRREVDQPRDPHLPW